MEGLEAVGSARSGDFLVQSRHAVRMRPGAADVPYAHDRSRPALAWRFCLAFAAMHDFMPQAQVLLAACRLPPADREAALAALLAARGAGPGFDPGNLRGSLAAERVVAQRAAWLATPLARERVALALTPARLYAQPRHGLQGRSVRSARLADVAALARRRAGLRDVGLEVFFAAGTGGGGGTGPDTWGAPSAFLVFGDREEREGWLEAMLAQPGLGAGPAGPPRGVSGDGTGGDPARTPRALLLEVSWGGDVRPRGLNTMGPLLRMWGPGGLHAWSLSADPHCHALCPPSHLPLPPPKKSQAGSEWVRGATAAWQRGALSNFDYLLFCNLAAGRSFSDLAQYPVFPWVLADYASEALDLDKPGAFRDLTKPVGALNPARLAAARARYADMRDCTDDPPFLYGTHYSCPSYVLYWLVRAAPGHMLRLQGGRFDAPDRLFASVAGAWTSALANPADVKELIPEFYLPGAAGFLRNGLGLALGTRQDGRPVGDVELPPWARGSPERFLSLQRAALEAPVVSANLHHWLDLVFGWKQRGAAALQAGNVFRHLTYEGEGLGEWTRVH